MKYRMNIVVEFDTETEIPEVDVTGTVAILENVFNHLPEPEGIDFDKSFGQVSLKKI